MDPDLIRGPWERGGTQMVSGPNFESEGTKKRIRNQLGDHGKEEEQKHGPDSMKRPWGREAVQIGSAPHWAIIEKRRNTHRARS